MEEKKPLKRRIMKNGRKPPMMKQKQKQCRKMNPSRHKNQSTQVMHGLRTM